MRIISISPGLKTQLTESPQRTGKAVETFDISEFYEENNTRDLLIRNKKLGAHLADFFSLPHTENGSIQSVVLMRGHGFTVVGGSIQESIFRAIYTAENATIQTASMGIMAAGARGNDQDRSIIFLDESEISGTIEMTKWSIMRPWELWVREVETSNLYVNLA